jgi:uncharacterized cupin superfamily protein
MTDREMIESVVASNGFTVERWDEEHENGLTAIIAGTFTVLEDDEEHGLYEGSEGVLEVCVVGSEEHRNRRVAFSLLEEGYDSSNEVSDLSLLEYR